MIGHWDTVSDLQALWRHACGGSLIVVLIMVSALFQNCYTLPGTYMETWKSAPENKPSKHVGTLNWDWTPHCFKGSPLYSDCLAIPHPYPVSSVCYILTFAFLRPQLPPPVWYSSRTLPNVPAVAGLLFSVTFFQLSLQCESLSLWPLFFLIPQQVMETSLFIVHFPHIQWYPYMQTFCPFIII